LLFCALPPETVEQAKRYKGLKKRYVHGPESPVFSAKFSRRAPYFSAEELRKGAQAFITAFETDFRNGQIRVAKKFAGTGESKFHGLTMGSLPKRLPIESQEMKGRKPGTSRDFAQLQRLRELLAHAVTRCEQPKNRVVICRPKR
jgi:hypothetical protein